MTNHNTTNNNHNHNNNNKIIRHHHHHHNNNLLPPPPTTRSNSTIQACAACRYQRRKCAPDCILAPYFPHDRQRQFQNAHKLFGVSNITKIIRHLDRPQKDEAMRTIIYQSDVRAQDPVGGCYRIIRELHRQIEIYRAEYEFVLQQLALCRTLAVQNNNAQNQNQNQNQNQQQFNHDLIIIDEIDYDIHLVNNPDDPNLYDDQSDNRQSHDFEIPLQQQDKQKYQNQFVSVKQDSGWEDNPAVTVQSWAAAGHDSPPSSQPSQTLHSSVCDDFKSLLINDISPEDKNEFKFEFKDTNEPSEEALFDEENHKGLIKVENVCFNEEDFKVKNASFATLTDCKAIQVEGE